MGFGGSTVSDTYRLLRFGVFELNLELEEIRKNGTPIKLPPQPFKLLALLASRSGQVVMRDEIQALLWGSDTFIDFEQGVNKCIKQIRTALSDNADNPLYLETIPRRGYRFLAPVRTKTIPAPPPLVREASSALLDNVAAQVRARVESASKASTNVAQPLAKRLEGGPAHQTLSVAPASPPPALNRLIWTLAPLTVLLAAVLYWVLSRAP
jgi:DNA-binding winged helix-turn-helix (wHTH) protein